MTALTVSEELSSLRKAASGVLRSYDAYCAWWDEDGNLKSIGQGGPYGLGFERQQVAWYSLILLREVLEDSGGATR